jgi:hypothetical protein
VNITYFEARPPAPFELIKKTVQSLGVHPESWLIKFWEVHNGAILNGIVLIYSIDEISERNKQYDIELDFPSYLLIGNDSGGRLLLIKKNAPDGFFLIDSGDPFIENALYFKSIGEILNEVCASSKTEFDFGKIVSMGAESIDSSDVLFLKKELDFLGSMAELKQKLSMGGEVIASDVNFIKYKNALDKCAKLIKFVS